MPAPTPSEPVSSEIVAGIHQLLGLYCHILDERAWDRLPQILTGDATLDAVSLGLGVHQGLDAIADLWRVIDHPVAHHVSAIVVLGTASPVDVVSKGFFAWPDGMSGGEYYDVAIRTAQGWRLKSRRYARRWSTRVHDRPAFSLG